MHPGGDLQASASGKVFSHVQPASNSRDASLPATSSSNCEPCQYQDFQTCAPCPPGMWSANQQLPCLLSKFLTARMFSHEFGDIINEAMYGHPHIPITLVLRKLLVAYGMHFPKATLHLSLYILRHIDAQQHNCDPYRKRRTS